MKVIFLLPASDVARLAPASFAAKGPVFRGRSPSRLIAGIDYCERSLLAMLHGAASSLHHPRLRY